MRQSVCSSCCGPLRVGGRSGNRETQSLAWPTRLLPPLYGPAAPVVQCGTAAPPARTPTGGRAATAAYARPWALSGSGRRRSGRRRGPLSRQESSSREGSSSGGSRREGGGGSGNGSSRSSRSSSRRQQQQPILCNTQRTRLLSQQRCSGNMEGPCSTCLLHTASAINGLYSTPSQQTLCYSCMSTVRAVCG